MDKIKSIAIHDYKKMKNILKLSENTISEEERGFHFRSLSEFKGRILKISVNLLVVFAIC